MKGVITHHDQSESCSNCDADIRVDTILDHETGRYYFTCPFCGSGNVEK